MMPAAPMTDFGFFIYFYGIMMLIFLGFACVIYLIAAAIRARKP